MDYRLEVSSRKTPKICEECKRAQDLKKIFDLHNNKKPMQQKRGSERDQDFFFIHNRSDTDIKRSISETNKNKTECPKCNNTLQRIRGLLDEIKNIRKHDVQGLCKRCFKSNVTGKCQKCYHLLNKFLSTKLKQYEKTQICYKEWLYKVKELLQSVPYIEAIEISEHKMSLGYDNIKELERLQEELKELANREPKDVFPTAQFRKSCSHGRIFECIKILEKVLLNLRIKQLSTPKDEKFIKSSDYKARPEFKTYVELEKNIRAIKKQFVIRERSEREGKRDYPLTPLTKERQTDRVFRNIENLENLLAKLILKKREYLKEGVPITPTEIDAIDELENLLQGLKEPLSSHECRKGILQAPKFQARNLVTKSIVKLEKLLVKLKKESGIVTVSKEEPAEFEKSIPKGFDFTKSSDYKALLDLETYSEIEKMIGDIKEQSLIQERRGKEEGSKVFPLRQSIEKLSMDRVAINIQNLEKLLTKLMFKKRECIKSGVPITPTEIDVIDELKNLILVSKEQLPTNDREKGILPPTKITAGILTESIVKIEKLLDKLKQESEIQSIPREEPVRFDKSIPKDVEFVKASEPTRPRSKLETYVELEKVLQDIREKSLMKERSGMDERRRFFQLKQSTGERPMDHVSRDIKNLENVLAKLKKKESSHAGLAKTPTEIDAIDELENLLLDLKEPFSMRKRDKVIVPQTKSKDGDGVVERIDKLEKLLVKIKKEGELLSTTKEELVKFKQLVAKPKKGSEPIKAAKEFVEVSPLKALSEAGTTRELNRMVEEFKTPRPLREVQIETFPPKPMPLESSTKSTIRSNFFLDKPKVPSTVIKKGNLTLLPPSSEIIILKDLPQIVTSKEKQERKLSAAIKDATKKKKKEEKSSMEKYIEEQEFKIKEVLPQHHLKRIVLREPLKTASKTEIVSDEVKLKKQKSEMLLSSTEITARGKINKDLAKNDSQKKLQEMNTEKYQISKERAKEPNIEMTDDIIVRAPLKRPIEIEEREIAEDKERPKYYQAVKTTSVVDLKPRFITQVEQLPEDTKETEPERVIAAEKSVRRRKGKGKGDTPSRDGKGLKKSKKKKAIVENGKSKGDVDLSDELSSDASKDAELKTKDMKQNKLKPSKSMNVLLKLLREKEKERKERERAEKGPKKAINIPKIGALPVLREHKKRIYDEDDFESIVECDNVGPYQPSEMIKGVKVVPFDPSYKEVEDIVLKPPVCPPPKKNELPIFTAPQEEVKEDKNVFDYDPEQCKGLLRYALSDPQFIENGWTKLPSINIMRRLNIYKMEPAFPKNDWFKRHKKDKRLYYDTGEKLAEIDEDCHGRWYYRNGILALDYYKAEEMNTKHRYIIYSSGERNESGKARPITILACFDQLGNGVVYDYNGNIRIKYNQSEGIVVDKKIGPPGKWKWHDLNDPPSLQPVMTDCYVEYPEKVLEDLFKKEAAEVFENEEKASRQKKEYMHKAKDQMLAMEVENFIKDKATKLLQKYKPFYIKKKFLKINEYFSLRIFDQVKIVLSFSNGKRCFKLNLGLRLISNEILDSECTEAAQVVTPYDRILPKSESVADIKRILEIVRKRNKRLGA